MRGVKDFLSVFLGRLCLEDKLRVLFSSKKMFDWFFDTSNVRYEWHMAQHIECSQCNRLYRSGGSGGDAAANNECKLIPEWCRASGYHVNMCRECYLKRPHHKNEMKEDLLYKKVRGAYKSTAIPHDECLTIEDNYNHVKHLQNFWYNVMRYELTRGGYKYDAKEAPRIHAISEKLVYFFQRCQTKLATHLQFQENDELKKSLKEFVKSSALFLDAF
jgi:hypothetical protein